MQLTFEVPEGYEPNSRFCFVCGKIGTERVGTLTCERHPEGLVRWSTLKIGNTALNDAIVYRGYVVHATDHSIKSEAHP